MSRKKIEVPMATLEFIQYEESGLNCYEFNATECQPPEPMVNAIHGLKLLKTQNDRLIGLFFHEPVPLYERIGSDFAHEAIELESGDFKIVFKLAL